MNESSGQQYPFLEENIQDLYYFAPCGHFSTLPDGTIIHVNITILLWLGYTENELVYKKKIQDLLTIGGKIYFETHLSPMLLMTGSFSEISCELIKKDKTTLPVLLNSLQIKKPDDTPLVNRFTALNVTDRKKYESELLHARKNAERIAQDKTSFLTTVSHEIRSPLNIIMGLVNLLEHTPLTSEQRAYLVSLQFASDHLLETVETILDTEKLEAGMVQLNEKFFSLQKFFHVIHQLFVFKAAEKNLELILSYDPQLPELVSGDETRIRQVVTNLLTNAIKFTPTGSVEIEVTCVQQSHENVVIKTSIKDSGIGIAAEKIDTLFQDYTQAHEADSRASGGYGLGLSISRKIIELYNSSIVVTSDSTGSEFSFVLNLKKGLSPLPVEEPTTDYEALENKSILVVDDNATIAMITEQFLRRINCQVKITNDGYDAIDLIQHNTYHLVLLDINLPVIDGRSVVTKIRALPGAHFQSLPIIAFSADHEIETDAMIALGFTDILRKPFRTKEFYSLLKKHLLAHVPFEPDFISFTDESPAHLKELMRLVKNNPTQFNELLMNCIATLETSKTELLNAIETSNTPLFNKIVHRLSSLLYYLEAKPLKQAINTIDRTLTNRNIQHYNILSLELDRLIDYLKTQKHHL